jgi:hypothetical protein
MHNPIEYNLKSARHGKFGSRDNRIMQATEAPTAEGNTMVPSERAILIGYFPKRVLRLPFPEGFEISHVVDICSVSECMSPGPEDWINSWRHNAMWCFDSPEIAQSIVPVGSAHQFHMFAYRMFPLSLGDGTEVDFVIPVLSVEPMAQTFDFLGFDAVSRSAGSSFECSPLSCNGAAESESVNSHCLIDDEADIMRLARFFAKKSNGFEPGPYFVVEVWRRTL